MTNDKQELQQEIKEKQGFVGDQKVREGIKPSQIRKLKRSKSLGDIPNNPLPAQPKTITLLEQENAELLKELRETQSLLDKSNEARYEALKKPSDNARITELQKELEETVKDAAEEITKLEDQNKQLRIKLTQINNQNSDLNRELNNYQRAAELRITEPTKEPDYNWWQDYGPIILLLGLYALSYWLLNHHHQKNYNE